MAPAITNSALNREIGELKTQVLAQGKQLDEMDTKMEALLNAVAMSKGSLKTLMAVGSLVAAIAAGLSSVLTWTLGKH